MKTWNSQLSVTITNTRTINLQREKVLAWWPLREEKGVRNFRVTLRSTAWIAGDPV